MESSVKQQLNGGPGNQQAYNQAPYNHNRVPMAKEQPLSFSNRSPSSGNGQKPYPFNSKVPKPLFPYEPKHFTSGKQEAITKPTHDRQSGNFVNHNVFGNSYPMKKNDSVIEIIDDDENEEKKSLQQPIDASIVNKQNFKNKQISNQLLSSSTNLKNDSHNCKNTDNLKNETRTHKNVTQNSKPQLWTHKTQLNHPKINTPDRNAQTIHPKNLQNIHKLQFNSTMSTDPYYQQYSNQRNHQFYDNMYKPPLMGMNYPPTMMNYQPNPMMSDNFYWAGNNVDRNFNLPMNSINSNNFLYAQIDQSGKNLPFIGANGMKNFTLDKNYGMHDVGNKDDRSLYKHPVNQSKDNPQSAKKSIQQRQDKPTVAKDLQKKDTASSVTQKKKQPQVIELLDSDDEDINSIKTQNKPIQKQNNITYPLKDQRSIPYSQTPSYPLKTVHGQNQFYPMNQQIQQLNPQLYNFSQVSQLSKAPSYKPQQYSQPSNYLQRPSAFQQTGKAYKQPSHDMMNSYIQKTKLIQKQPRPDAHKTKNLSEDRGQLLIEKFENLQNLKTIKQHREHQQKDLTSLLSHPTPFIQNQIGLNPNLPIGYQQSPHAQINKLPSSQYPSPLMSSDTFIQEKLMDLQNYLGTVKNQPSLMDIEQMKKLEEFYNKTGLSLSKFRQHYSQYVEPQRESQSRGFGTYNKNEKIVSTKIQPQTSSYNQHISTKQISGTEHVKRQVQKAFLKTRSRIINQQNSKQSSTNNSSNQEGKKLLTYERMQQITEEYKKSFDGTYKKIKNGKIECENEEKQKQKQKSSGWVFEWTPRLKRLRDLSKKREYDSVILIGPQFQAQLPKFITDIGQLRRLKTIKRANLLKRLYKYCSQI